jgi:hypothetical protein
MWLSPSLIWLKLRNNNLYGELSSTLQKCTGLFALDLGGDKFFGAIVRILVCKLDKIKGKRQDKMRN